MADQGESCKDEHAHNLLPPSAREALIRAAKISDPWQRRIAIEAAEAMARARNPELFRRED